MSSSIDSAISRMSYTEYAANFTPDQYDIYDSTPEQVFAKYNVQDMSQ